MIKDMIRNAMKGMMRKGMLLSAAALAAITASAESVVIKNPGTFENPVRDGYAVFPDTLYFDRDAEEITFPDMGAFVNLGDYDFPNLRKVVINNVDYMPGSSFWAMRNLEEIVVNGRVGHFDCVFAGGCPNLRKIVFNGPVSSTGGPSIHYACPQLEKVEFNGLVVALGLEFMPQDMSPRLREYTINGAVIKAYSDSVAPAGADEIRSNPRMMAQMKELAKWQSEVLTASCDNRWMRKTAYEGARTLLPMLDSLGCVATADSLKAAMDFAWNRGDEVKTMLDILKESPAYAADTIKKPDFAYVLPSDSMLTATRLHFNLDSIAGTGSDVERIKNLLYWVHDNIRHDGNNGLPKGPRSLQNIYYSARRDSCGWNCRALAIALTEALLAEGIPARYLTCESKKWDSDQDCHVICVAWSESLNKWIWVDPTFAAYVADENGLLLHPGEVRYRLQNDLPLVLNADANWNNEYFETKEDYLEDYMAKNLYIMSANLLNQAEPEGMSAHKQGYAAALVPAGSNYSAAYVITTDEDWFWQAPSEFRVSSEAR